RNRRREISSPRGSSALRDRQVHCWAEVAEIRWPNNLLSKPNPPPPLPTEMRPDDFFSRRLNTSCLDATPRRHARSFPDDWQTTLSEQACRSRLPSPCSICRIDPGISVRTRGGRGECHNARPWPAFQENTRHLG